MSKYLEDIQGKIVSNPINETNTKYPHIEKTNGVYHGDDYHIDTQYMYNHDEPVSDFDTAYYDDYRNKVEELRKRTESTYEALESCLVPVEIPGMSFQPYEFVNTETPDGEVIQEKVKSFTYFFQDHLSPIGKSSKEYVFRTNKVKFIDDRHRRLIYDRTIHIMTLKEDEDNRVSFKDVILRNFFEYRNNKYYPLVKNIYSSNYTYDDIANLIMKYLDSTDDTYTIVDKNGNEKKLENYKEFETYSFKSGVDIDTKIPSTLYNLYNIGWTNAAIVFLNGLAIEWTKITLSVDNIDTFIIVSNLNMTITNKIDDDKEIFLDYIHIPFKVAYLCGNVEKDSLDGKYIKSNGDLTNQIVFAIDKTYATVTFTEIQLQSVSQNFKQANLGVTGNSYDRIICLDPNIKYAEFELGKGDSEALKDSGINYTKSFREFCDNDYRCKLKQFNFLGFELDRYSNQDMNYTSRCTFKNDDFSITWHPFNIMDIRFKRLFNRKRVFKVFYNTKVLYDQDNILRIKNHDRLADEYEEYRKDVTANIETFLNEIYILAKKDIGTYLATNGLMYNYKFHYVTPYECFLLYNAINMSIDSSYKYTSFEDFRKINVAGIKDDSSAYKSVINPKLVANSNGKCIWRISTGHNQCPVVKITEVGTNDIVLADVDYSDSNEIVITMYKNGMDIIEGTYQATLYYASYIVGNPDLKSSNGKFSWTIENIDANSTVTAVYESETNQIVLPDIQVLNDNSIKINISTKEDNIKADTYKAVIYLKSTDKHSYLNYLNGGFIAVPKDEDSMFAEKIKEKDILNKKSPTEKIKKYVSDIVKNAPGVTIADILIPIDNETRDDSTSSSDAFYMYEGDTKGKMLPYLRTMNEFGLVQEYDDLSYDNFKIRFELSYLNNMEEGATPVDEFIYYYDNLNVINMNTYPTVSTHNIANRKTAIILEAMANNIFKSDPHLVLDSIKKLIWSADYLIPAELTDKKENYITTCKQDYSSTVPSRSYDFRADPKCFYNYGYYDDNNVPHKLLSEWCLRRNLPEMFIYKLDEDKYTLDSMHLLDEVFDFTYNLDKSYEENLKDGLNYIIGYDADKLEQSIKRSIVSITKTGEELLSHIAKTHYEKICTLDDYKLITFIKNKNQKIAFDNIKIIVTVNVLGDSVTPFLIKYINEDGKESEFTYAEMKHKSQENSTIIKTTSSFKDVDKNFEQKFTSVKYNRKTELLEYYNGDELVITLQVDKVIDLNRVVMSRWNIGQQDNYVMIFKNRELYSEYHTIEYTDLTFSFEFDTTAIAKTDKFEFVFFLNANNRIMKKVCETDEDLKLNIPSAYYSRSTNSIRTDKNGNPMDKGLYENITNTTTLDKAIACNTSLIDAENVQLLVNVMPKDKDDKWDVKKTDNTAYELSYKMKSYMATTATDNSKRYIHSLSNDEKINGLHRVTKQGGGEYFLEFDGKVPSNSGTGSGGTIVKPGTGGGSSGMSGIGLMALATKNVVSIEYTGTKEEWNKISKTLPWIRDANNLNNSGGIKCSDGSIKVPSDETLVGRGE